MTPEQVAAAVAKVVASEQGALQERRYLFNQNILVGKVRCAAVSGGPSWQRLLASRALDDGMLCAVIASQHMQYMVMCESLECCIRCTTTQYIVMFQVRTELKWAEVSAVKAEVEQQVAALLGPRTEEDAAAAAAPKKKVRCCKLSLVWSSLLCLCVPDGYGHGNSPCGCLGSRPTVAQQHWLQAMPTITGPLAAG